MKLYTEEQVMEAFHDGIKYASIMHPASIGEYNKYVQATINSLTPIELPSDEEIEKYIEKTFYGEKKHYFKAGVEFMKEQILNQNK